VVHQLTTSQEMTHLDEAKDLSEYFSREYRNPKLEPFEISELYDLFPNESGNTESKNKWNNPWPNNLRAGVYLILSADLEVIYIGKSGNTFGDRLKDYFKYDADRNCRLEHIWNTDPKYVVTVAVPDSSKFESSALEGYLLSKIKTSDNIQEVS